LSKVGGEYTFDCQHGEAECQGNIVETCAFELYDLETKAWPFVLCLEQTDKRWNTEYIFL
jgi:interferon gamma-inducible protein 30